MTDKNFTHNQQSDGSILAKTKPNVVMKVKRNLDHICPDTDLLLYYVHDRVISFKEDVIRHLSKLGFFFYKESAYSKGHIVLGTDLNGNYLFDCPIGIDGDEPIFNIRFVSMEFVFSFLYHEHAPKYQSNCGWEGVLNYRNNLMNFYTGSFRESSYFELLPHIYNEDGGVL